MTKATATPNTINGPTFPKPTGGPYTTTTCNPTITTADISVKVGYEKVENNTVRITTPQYNVTSCYGTTLVGFKISALPTKGDLYLKNVAVQLNDVISKADWPKLEYRLNVEQNGSDQAKFKVVCSNGGGGTVEGNAANINFNIIEEPNDTDCNCTVTTTTVHV